MKIEIETKYNIGDLIWTSEYDRDVIRPVQYEIFSITVLYQRDRHIIIYVTTKGWNVAEYDVYATEQECWDSMNSYEKE